MSEQRVPSWRRYVRFWRPDPRRDVDDEMRFHFESLVDELARGGMSEPDARAEASRRFADVGPLAHTLYNLSLDQERTMQRTEWLGALLQDLRFGARQLIKAPGFTLVAVLTLGLGIGATTSIFSVVYSVLLHPLPFTNADRALALWQHHEGGKTDVTYGAYATWAREARAFEVIGATRHASPLTLTGHGEPTPVYHTRASASYWKAMHIAPALGRYFGEDVDRQGAAHVAVLSYALWRNRFDQDSAIIGRSLTLNGLPFTVVAVAPPGYVTEPPLERIWSPLAPAASQLVDFGDHELAVYGLLRPDVDAAQGVAELSAIERRLLAENPHNGFDGTIVALSLIDDLVGDTRSMLLILLGAVGLVLLIACGNVANLLIARGATRRAEIAVRAAVGASRTRIVSQLLAESSLLAVAGAVVGIGLAVVATGFLVRSPVPLARLRDSGLNTPVLAFAITIGLASTIVFGLLPAIRATGADLQLALREGGREGRSASRDRLRRSVIVAELCLAQVLLVGAGLLVQSARRVSQIAPGFDPGNLLMTLVTLPPARYASTAEVDAAFQRMDAAIAAVPGVTSVARTQAAPIYSGGWGWTAFREGSDGHDAGSGHADVRAVTPGYFATLRMRLIMGRDFSANDRAGGARVAIVSATLARQFFNGANPLGKRISNGTPENPGWREIIGVADDIHADGLTVDPIPTLYVPAAQFVNGGQTYLVRADVPVRTLVPAVRRAVGSVDPLVALTRVGTMEDAIADSVAVPRFSMWLITLLGATGLLLAVVGVYGVIAYFVTQRTRELGVRMALGADARAVRWLVVRQGLLLGLLGVVAGIIVSLAATRLLSAYLYGITARDPATFAAVAGAMLVTAIAASYLPARRATRIDPLQAIRAG
jgi:predicted permease